METKEVKKIEYAQFKTSKKSEFHRYHDFSYFPFRTFALDLKILREKISLQIEIFCPAEGRCIIITLCIIYVPRVPVHATYSSKNKSVIIEQD